MMNSNKHQPLIDLLNIKNEEISNASIIDVFNFAEEKINASPSGRSKHLALLFYLINKLKEAGLSFYVKGGLISQYYLKDKARPTKDLDIIIPGDINGFYQSLEKFLNKDKGPLTFKISDFSIDPSDEKYYYDIFNIEIDVLYKNEKHDQLVIDGIASPIFKEIEPVQYKGPAIITPDFEFNGVPIEYVAAEKIIAVTNELKRPYKHLVDLYSLIHTDLDIKLTKKFVKLINEHDNQMRVKLNKPTRNDYLIKDDKVFADNYLFPLLQAGYQIDLSEMKKEINHWLENNL